MNKSRFLKRPEDNVSDYIISKEAVKFSQLAKCEQVDWPEVKLRQEKRNLEEIQRQLELKKDEYERKRSELKKQWKEMALKQIELRSNFVKFNRFIKENLEKRIRAVEQIKEETKFREETERKIEEMSAKLENLKKDKLRLDQEIKKFQIYIDFLEQVVSHNEELPFKTIDELIFEYENLAETRTVLGERQESNFLQLTEIQLTASKFFEESRLEIIGLATKLASLNTIYDACASRSRKWENVVAKIKDYGGRMKDEADLARASILNLCKLMEKRKMMKSRGFDESDIMSQVLFIKETLKQVEDVNAALEERNASLVKKKKHERSRRLSANTAKTHIPAVMAVSAAASEAALVSVLDFKQAQAQELVQVQGAATAATLKALIYTIKTNYMLANRCRLILAFWHSNLDHCWLRDWQAALVSKLSFRAHQHLKLQQEAADNNYNNY